MLVVTPDANGDLPLIESVEIDENLKVIHPERFGVCLEASFASKKDGTTALDISVCFRLDDCDDKMVKVKLGEFPAHRIPPFIISGDALIRRADLYRSTSRKPHRKCKDPLLIALEQAIVKTGARVQFQRGTRSVLVTFRFEDLVFNKKVPLRRVAHVFQSAQTL